MRLLLVNADESFYSVRESLKGELDLHFPILSRGTKINLYSR